MIKHRSVTKIAENPIKILTDYINSLVNSKEDAGLDIHSLPEEYAELGKGLVSLSTKLEGTENCPQGSDMELIRKQAEDLERSNSLFKTITGMMSEWIVMIDKETGEHLFANHPVQNDLASDIFEDQLYSILMDYAKDTSDDSECYTDEFPLISDYAIQWFSIILYPVKWDGHNAVSAVLTDITEEKDQLKELEDVAYKDPLTGAYNRHFGMELLNDWVSKKISFIICFVDMDKLKYVNDVFGHGEGDAYIKSVADLLNEFSADPYVCRLGGDEFMVLTTGISMEAAEKRSEELRTKFISEYYETEDGNTYQRSISYGIIEAPGKDDEDASELLAAADEKMYAYKKAHKQERRDLA